MIKKQGENEIIAKKFGYLKEKSYICIENHKRRGSYMVPLFF